MSKINQNKIIGLLFIMVAFILIFLSFQKNDSKNEILVDNYENKFKTEVIAEVVINKPESVISEVEVEKIKESKPEIDYLSYDLILGSEKITGIFTEGDTLYDSLLIMKEKELVTFEDKNFSGLGAYIYSINGVSEERRKGKYWIYYVNDEKANVGVSNYLLKEKDEVRWHLENNTN